MPRRNTVNVHDRVALAPAASPLEKDLGINPISYLTVVLRLLNNGANAVPELLNILGVISRLEVLLDNKTLVGGSLRDLAAMTYALWGAVPQIQVLTQTDNNVINAAVHIPFGRKPFWPAEALPTTRKGDLMLRITPAAAFTQVDTLTITVSQHQILDAAPERFLKYSDSGKAAVVGDQNEIDLVTGPDYVGALLFGTTVPTAASQTATIAKLSLKVDDLETMYADARWEMLHGDLTTLRQNFGTELDHTHMENLAAAYTQFATTDNQVISGSIMANHVFLDFDPTKDPEMGYRLITRGRSRVHIRWTADVADAMRILPVEVVSLAGE